MIFFVTMEQIVAVNSDSKPVICREENIMKKIQMTTPLVEMDGDDQNSLEDDQGRIITSVY